MTLLLFCAVIFFIAVTGRYVFGDIGLAITAFFMGLAGYFIYPLLLLAIYCSAVLVSGKKLIPARWLLRTVLLLAAVFFIVHTATSERFFAEGYGGYLAGCWSAAGEGLAQGTGGGVIFGIIAYPVRAALSAVGAYILYSLLIVLALYFILIATPLRAVLLPSARARREKPAPAAEEPKAVAFDDLPSPAHTAMPEASAQPAPAYGYPAAAQNAPSYPAYSATQPAASASAQPAVSSQNQYERSRSMLFGGDPASSYRNNLIFDSDSQFNTQPRRSSVRPVEEGAQPAQPAQPQSYAERYAAEASATRPAMPRQVTQIKPDVPAADDFNYPQSPSYRAPADPAAEEAHDYYVHDVDEFAGLSSQPTIDDVPVEPAAPAVSAAPAAPAPEPVRPSYEAPAPEPARPSYEAPVSEPARPSYEAPAPEPVRPSYEAPAETPAPRADEREQTFRSIFSQPVPERTRVQETPVRPSYEAPAQPAAPAMPEARPFESGDEDTMSARSRMERPSYEAPVSEPVRPSYEEPVRPSYEEPAPDTRFSSDNSAAGLFDDEDDDVADFRRDDSISEPVRAERGERTERSERALRAAPAAATPVPAEEAPAPQRHVYKPYVLPSTDCLGDYANSAAISQEEVEQNSAVIVDTLAGFRVDAEVIRVTTGATVTRYDIDIPRNIAVSQVIKRDAEIAMRLHTRDGVNIYSNSEAGAISIEVPNSVRSTVGLKAVMQAEEYKNGKPGSLMFAVGQDVEGRNVVGNIVKMTHILVAGSTNSGKSICLDSMLISLVCKYSPEELRLILIDPKKTEFIVFDGLPHLMINEIISDAQKAVAAFNWAIKEMERRFDLFEKKTRAGINVRNIDEYNNARTEDDERLPKLVIVVDELADLMSVAKKDIEERIQRLTQKARAAGIHLVLATQRPSVDVITGVIKSNLPTRMALRVISDVDSRTILDESGAQKLLGNGDMLYRTGGMFNSMRVQGAFVSSQEMQDIVEDIKAHNEAYFDTSVADFINKTEGEGGSSGSADAEDGSVDPQYIKALGIVVKLGQASISLIQRKCSVGYNHAGKIIEWMELMGYISPFDGKAKARSVLLTKEDFEAKYGDIN